MSLTNICYEQIKDDYWYGLYGDFKLIINKHTSMFNATKLCMDGGKRFKKWYENNHSKELIKLVEEVNGSAALNIVAGGQCGLIRGTYVSQELILSIASWISSAFYLKCNKIILNHYNKQFEEEKVSLNNKLEEVTILMDQIKVKNEHMVEDMVPKPQNPGKAHTFALIHKNVDGADYPYYVVRPQHCSFKKAMDTVKAKYPKSETIYQLKYNPNTVNLFVRMKEAIPSIKTSFNNIKLDEGYSIDELVMDIKNLCPKILG